MLTLQKLKDMPANKIFVTGIVKDNPEGINMTNSGRDLRWIAKRGGIHDWAIYIHWSENTIEWIADYGDKVYNKEHIKKLIECDEEAFNMYRY